MRKLSFLVLLVLALGLQSCMLTAYMVAKEQLALNPKVLNCLKDEKVVIATMEYPKKASAEDKEKIDRLNEFTVNMLKEHWTYCEIHDVMPFEEAKKFVWKNRGYHLLSINNTGYRIVTNGPIPQRGDGDYGSIGIELDYFVSAMKSKPAAFEFPFTMSESFINEVSTYASIMAFQDMLKQIETKKIPSQQSFPKNGKRNTDKIKNKTLLIPEYMVNNKLGEEGIKKYYKYDFEICSKEKFEEAILNGLEGYVFPLYNTVPAGKATFNQFMIYDSETWECYLALRFAQNGASNYKIFASKDYHDFLKMNKKTWKNIAKGMKSV